MNLTQKAGSVPTGCGEQNQSPPVPTASAEGIFQSHKSMEFILWTSQIGVNKILVHQNTFTIENC